MDYCHATSPAMLGQNKQPMQLARPMQLMDPALENHKRSSGAYEYVSLVLF